MSDPTNEPSVPTPPPAASPYGAPAAPPYGSTNPYAGQRTNTLAIIALIAAFVFSPAGIVCGHIALGQIKRTGEGGRALALWGTILGYVFTALWVLIVFLSIIIPLLFLASVGSQVGTMSP